MFNRPSPVHYWRLSSFYFFYFALLGAWLPFWPLYLVDLGFDAQAIGVITGVLMATRIIAPGVWGWVSDRVKKRISLVRLGAFISLLGFLLIFYRQSYGWILLVVSMHAFFWNAILPQFEVITLTHLREKHQLYGKIRVWGSIGFIASVMLLGWSFDVIAISFLPWVLTLLMLAIWISSLSVNEPESYSEQSHSDASLISVIKQPFVICFLISCFLLQISHGPYYTFFSVYLEQHHYSRTLTGMFWSLGVVAEMIIFLVMHRLFARFSLRSIMIASLALSVIRWGLIAFYADSWPVLIIAQCLHAASFGSYHAFAVEFIRRVFPDKKKGQGMALYSGICFGLGGALGAVLSGWGWEFSPSGTFVAAAIICFIALLVALLPAASHDSMRKSGSVE